MQTPLVTQCPILIRRTDPAIHLCHLRRIQQRSAIEQCRSLCCAIVTAIGTCIDLCTASVCIARICALEAIIAIAVKLTGCAITCTLAETITLTAVSTGQVLHPIVTCGLVCAYLDIIAYTSISIWITLIAESRRIAAIRVILYTAHAAGRCRTPCAVCHSLLRTGVNCRICTTCHTVIIRLAIVRTLAISFSLTTSGTNKRCKISVALDTFRFAMITRAA
jgi:hypothetical protein